MSRTLVRIAFACVFLAAIDSLAVEEQKKDAEEKKDSPLTTEEAKSGNAKVAIPQAKAILGALDHITRDTPGQIAWPAVLAYAQKDVGRTDFADPKVRALNLGLRLSDAFLAIQSEDKEAFARIVKDIEALGRPLGIDDDLKKSVAAATELGNAGNWKGARRAIVDLQSGTEAQLRELDRGDEAVLIAVAAWLEGVHLCARALGDNYSPEAAVVFRQAGLVLDIAAQLGTLKPETKSLPQVKTLTGALLDVQLLIDVAQTETVSKEKVAKLQAITAKVVTAIAAPDAK